MLTPDMKRIVREQPLGYVATAAADGTPNVSPKGTFFVVDDTTIAFAEIRSPATVRNLKANPRIEVNFIDPFVRKGYRFAGTAKIIERGEGNFDELLKLSGSSLAPRVRADRPHQPDESAAAGVAGLRRRHCDGDQYPPLMDDTFPQAAAGREVRGMTARAVTSHFADCKASSRASAASALRVRHRCRRAARCAR